MPGAVVKTDSCIWTALRRRKSKCFTLYVRGESLRQQSNMPLSAEEKQNNAKQTQRLGGETIRCLVMDHFPCRQNCIMKNFMDLESGAIGKPINFICNISSALWKSKLISCFLFLKYAISNPERPRRPFDRKNSTGLGVEAYPSPNTKETKTVSANTTAFNRGTRNTSSLPLTPSLPQSGNFLSQPVHTQACKPIIFRAYKKLAFKTAHFNINIRPHAGEIEATGFQC